jgi:dienelactone hydrolase
MKITIERGVWRDAARGGRAVPWKLTRPADDAAGGPWPVVVWSHGLGGSREGAGFLARALAGAGIAALHLTHPGTDTSLWEGKPGHPWDVMRAVKIPRADTLARFADVPFALGALAAEGRGDLDMARVGMSGHSFGALTTQVMMGQLFPGDDGVPRSFAEPRFAAAIAYSPNPMGHLAGPSGVVDGFYRPIRGPIAFVTGTADDSPFGDFDHRARVAVHDAAGAADKALIVLEGADHMVFAGSRGQLGPNPRRAEHEAAIVAHALDFWRRTVSRAA